VRIHITVLDAIECKIAKEQAKHLIPCLSYKSTFWRKGQFKKINQAYRKQVFSFKNKEDWFFYTGHLDRVLNFCNNKGWETKLKIHDSFNVPWVEPNIPGFTLREDQKRAVKIALAAQRGVIKEPTGTGKTILQMGIMSAFKKGNILLLAHTTTIVNQTARKIRKLGWNCTQIGGGVEYIGAMAGVITIATIQSFAKIPKDDYCEYFDIVIVDEAHRVSSFDGQYANVLGNILAPVRLGFTATLPTTTKAKLALEGFLGKLLSEQTINEATEKEIISVPKIKLIKSAYRQKVRNKSKYVDVYQAGIVSNLSRNKQIVEVVKAHKEKGETTLIFVNKIKHGDNLKELFLKDNIRVPFVKGDMPNDKREIIKTSLKRKKRKIVIATIAWQQGVDIPSLDVVFNAGGGKDELGVLQLIGRGLRRTDDKESVIIYDFFDPSHHYLISHFGERVSLYMKHNWL